MLILLPKLLLTLEFHENNKCDFWVYFLLKIFVIVNSSFTLEILTSITY